MLVGEGSPGYWSYSVNSVLNSLGRIRNDFPQGVAVGGSVKGDKYPDAGEFYIFCGGGCEGSLFNDEVIDAPAFNKGDKLTGSACLRGECGICGWACGMVFRSGI